MIRKTLKLSRRKVKNLRVRQVAFRRFLDRLGSVRQRVFKKRSSKKIYNGNIFERFVGLEFIFEHCDGCSLLDIGSADGLIDYEFAPAWSPADYGV